MKYFSQDHQYINAECDNCGRVLKISHRNCVATLGGLSVIPTVLCHCGTTSDFIGGASLDYWKITGGTRVENDHHMYELIDLIARFLPLYKWDFKMNAHYICYSNKWDTVLNAQNFHGLGDPVVFYNSKKCRIRIEYSWNSREYERSINVKYGRLEVPDNASVVLSSVQEKDYPILWHSVFYALDFLDGLSPQEAKNASRPRLVMEFEQSDLAKSIKSEPERDIRLQAMIWENYGQSLFDIFDVRNKDLWNQYSTFVNEYWKTLPQV